MASEWVQVGRVQDTDGRTVVVWRKPGTVGLVSATDTLAFESAELGKLCELLDRAAMPGQPDGRPCCPHCDHGDGPDAHDPGDPVAHDGPCPRCQTGEQS